MLRLNGLSTRVFIHFFFFSLKLNRFVFLLVPFLRMIKVKVGKLLG